MLALSWSVEGNGEQEEESLTVHNPFNRDFFSDEVLDDGETLSTHPAFVPHLTPTPFPFLTGLATISAMYTESGRQDLPYHEELHVTSDSLDEVAHSALRKFLGLAIPAQLVDFLLPGLRDLPNQSLPRKFLSCISLPSIALMRLTIPVLHMEDLKKQKEHSLTPENGGELNPLLSDRAGGVSTLDDDDSEEETSVRSTVDSPPSLFSLEPHLIILALQLICAPQLIVMALLC
jgi:hypothetical protein